MKHPKISVVMPAFNTEKFIKEAIESVLNQTFSDWELIIVDDASTDSTYFIAKEYAEKDDRIKLTRLSENSGAAQIPRHKAISMAHGDWILGLDSDDYVEKDDLNKLFAKAIETGADIVLHRLVSVGIGGEKIGDAIPAWSVDMDNILTGKEACMKTLVNWEINGNGIFKVELYHNLLHTRKVTNMHSDEYDTRLLFLNASRVALCDAEYYYRKNPDSITNKIGIKRFDLLDIDKDLDELIKKECGEDTKEYIKVVTHRVNNLIALTRVFIQNDSAFSTIERKIIINRLKMHYKCIDRKYCFQTSFIKRNIFMNGWRLFYLSVYVYFLLKK